MAGKKEVKYLWNAKERIIERIFCYEPLKKTITRLKAFHSRIVAKRNLDTYKRILYKKKPDNGP